MSSKKPSNPQAKHVAMVGEGLAVPVAVEHLSMEDGVTTATARVDLSGAPAPTRKFVADCFEIRREFTEARLLFGQRKVDGTSIRALLDIRYAFEAILSFSEVMQGLNGVSREEEKFETNFSDEPEQSIALQANFARINAGGPASTLDFYSASGFAMSKFISDSFLYAEPVVRISMPNQMVAEISKVLLSKFGRIKQEG